MTTVDAQQRTSRTLSEPASRVEDLEEHGIVVLPNLVSGERLVEMQRAFRARLARLRCNDVDGYEKTGRYRHMVQDVLTLAQGFVDAALHPVVTATLDEYLGDGYELVEAKGWLSHPTRKDFHGWHGDMWYDQREVEELQREVKLALYLTDVQSGAFAYIKGTHGRMHPRVVRDEEVKEYPASDVIEVTGTAGTGILFDTTGIHRQAVPILEPREAVFYCYHDPSVPLQQVDVEYYRYHPLILNAAFLGGLTEKHQRILGFGNKTNYVPAFQRKVRQPGLHRAFSRMLDMKLAIEEYRSLWRARFRRVVGRR